MLYKDSGVDIGKGDALVDFIKGIVRKQRENIGPFSAVISTDFLKEYKDPVLLASTDGVGTKIDLALRWNYLDGIGYDLFAMCVNDIATYGAKPLFFLDYYATGKLDLGIAKIVITSLVKACEEYDCPLVGGETAELPGLLSPDKFDIAGFVLGVQERSKLPNPDSVRPGDVLIGLPSSGIHSNGYSLVRAIIDKVGIERESLVAGEKAVDVFLRPTRIYVKIAMEVFKNFIVKGAAHITGGGIPGNLVRCLPQGVKAVIYSSRWRIPEVFVFLKEAGNVPDSEMWRVFNMGIGFIFILSRDELPRFSKFLEEKQEVFYEIGEIQEGERGVEIL